MFHSARGEDIKAGRVTDVYFLRTLEILEQKKINATAVGEVTLKAFPDSRTWGILAGIEEVASLLEGLPVDVDAFLEGASFRTGEPETRFLSSKASIESGGTTKRPSSVFSVRPLGLRPRRPGVRRSLRAAP
jgi:nicotinic acid phosphoribosyltransferase